MLPFSHSSLLIVAAAFGPAITIDQDPPRVTAADYERARTLQSPMGLVRNPVVVHHWIGDRDEFWYRRDTDRGAEYTVVEAATGRKRLAFDHAAMAAALGRTLGEPLAADQLPLSNVVFQADGALRVSVPAPGDQVARNGRLGTPDRDFRCRLAAPASCEAVVVPPAQRDLDRAPDGRQGVFVRTGNLWVRDIGTGAERQLTRDGQGADFGYGIIPDGWKATVVPRERLRAAGQLFPPFAVIWSPDSRTVLFPRIDQRHVAPYPFVETVPEDGSARPRAHAVRIPMIGERPPELEWYLADLGSGTVTRVAFPYEKLLVIQQDLLPLANFWWSPDQRHLYTVAFGDNMEAAWLFDINVATGAVRTVLEERAQPRLDLNSTSYNPPNVRVTADGSRLIWWSERDGWGHLYLYDMATGRLLNQITSGSWLVRDLIHVDEGRGLIYFTAGGREGGNPYYRRLYRVRFDGTGFTRISPDTADVMVTAGAVVSRRDGGSGGDAVSPSGKYVVYNASTPSRPTETVIRRAGDGGLVALVERTDASQLIAAGFRAPEEFTARTADGADVTWNAVYRPLNFDSTRKYPVVDVNYASPMTAVVPRNFLMAIRGPSGVSPAAFAALGFVVVVVDGRGTTFRSHAFTQSSYGRLQINGIDDHMAAIKELGRRYSWVDTTRVGITGGSYGGWSTIRGMLEYPDFYKVGFAESPPGGMHNMYVDYHWTAQHGRPVYADGGELKTAPAEVPANWKVLDGREQAARLKGHLMMTVSELDENVLPGSTMQFIDALMKADRNFDVLTLPDTPHGSGRYTAYTMRRRWDYFVRHLMGAVPPSEAMEP